MKTMKNGSLFALGSLLVCFGCAGSNLGLRGSSGTVTSEQLRARNQALNELIVTALKPCETKAKPEDAGLILVTAKPDGSVTVGPMQWQGGDEMKQCIVSEAPKAKLPAWNGPQVTWPWAISTKTAQAPQPLAEAPASYRERQVEYVRKAQGNAGSGNDSANGPLAACAQRTLPPEAYALVGLRLFIFPDGKVAGVTPVFSEAEGRDAAFLDCAAQIPKDWTFDGFPGPSFTTLDVQLKQGVNPLEK